MTYMQHLQDQLDATTRRAAELAEENLRLRAIVKRIPSREGVVVPKEMAERLWGYASSATLEYIDLMDRTIQTHLREETNRKRLQARDDAMWLLSALSPTPDKED